MTHSAGCKGCLVASELLHLSVEGAGVQEVREHCCPVQESTLPGTLGGICDAMASNGSICQGFVYNSYTGTAFFKGNATDTQIDTSQLCLSPNSTAWLLSSGTATPVTGLF